MDLFRSKLRGSGGGSNAAGGKKGAGPRQQVDDGDVSGALAAGPSAPSPTGAASVTPLVAPPTTWSPEELAGLDAVGEYGGPHPPLAYEVPFSRYNPTPGTGRTGFLSVPPNNYPFYRGDARYTPVVQPDGGQLSEWVPMYAPTKEQAEEDRRTAYANRVPHGFVPHGSRVEGGPTIELTVVSDLHTEDEYGAQVGADGRHHGGPFVVCVSPKIRVEELRRVIRDVGGILPALQRLSFAGKHLNDAQRTLEHYGIPYYHAKFPHWPIKIRRH